MEIRNDLTAAHEQAWNWIAGAGTWLDGAHRVAVAAETRNSRNCAFCAEQAAALSPNAVSGKHDGLGELQAAEIEMIHRIASDPGRLTRGWCEDVLGAGIGEGPYVEIVGLVAMVMVMDTFRLAIGLAPGPLPESQIGEPTRYRPPGAQKNAAWLPIVEPGDETLPDGPLYPNPKIGYIQRALTSVPESKRAYWNLVETHYLPPELVPEFTSDRRAISRPQVELLAARVSALHQCVY